MGNIIKKNKKWIIITIALLILINILNVIAPYFLKIIIDKFTYSSWENDIIYILLAYVITRIIIVFINMLKNKTTNKLSIKILSELRTETFEQILAMKIQSFSKFPSSDIYTRLTVDAENVKDLFSRNLPIVINDFLHVLFIIIIMFIINIKLAFIGLICIMIMGVSLFFIIRKLRKIQKDTLNKRDLENKQFSEDYNKSKVTKFFELQEKNIQKANNLMDDELKNRKKYTYTNSLPWPISICIEILVIYLVMYFVLNIDVTISLGTVYIFLYYIRQCFSPLKELFNQLEEIQTATVSLERIDIILKNTQKEDIDGGINVQNLKGDIEFRNVEFRYNKQIVLNNLSFKIKQGTKTAIVGKTGVGKTTITSILMKLYKIQKGKILIDGYDLDELSIRTIRSNITYISQDVYVLKDTVRNNILLEKKDVSDKEILEIMKNIGALSLLERLDNGLDEKINVDRLSKGELQIIAFIRAMVHGANIYIFDEPTSNIDLKTEKMIQNIIDKISQNSTVIIIAHRLSTIKNVDSILLLEDGSISETNKCEKGSVK